MVMENRQYERFNLELPLLYRSLDLVDYLPSKTRNVSLGGFSSVIDLHAHDGRLLQLKLLLPNEHDIIEFMARLSWSKRISPSKYEAGFEVLDLVVDYKNIIEKLFSNLVFKR
jgi:hypothetical protein